MGGLAMLVCDRLCFHSRLGVRGLMGEEENLGVDSRTYSRAQSHRHRARLGKAGRCE